MIANRPLNSASDSRPWPGAQGAADANAWQLDLSPVASGAPLDAGAAVPAGTSVAHLNGRNLRYVSDTSGWAVEMPYMQADLVDLKPQHALTIWNFGTYKIKVRSGEAKLSEAQANRMLASMTANQPALTNAHLAFQANNRVELTGQGHWKGLSLPLVVRAHVALAGPSEVRLTPESVRLFGVPVLWAAKLLHLNLGSKLPLPQDGSVSIGSDLTVHLDASKSSLFEGQLDSLQIGPEGAVVTLGDPAPAPVSGARTRDVANYCEVKADGEVALDSAIIRNATVMLIDNTPEDPYGFNHWDTEGFAHIESGEVILDEERLRKRFASAGDFKMDSAHLEGTAMAVSGIYPFHGIDIPLSFKLNFSASPSGQLLLTPTDAKVIGIGMGFIRSKLLGVLAGMPGCRREGAGVVLDMRQSASVEMPFIREVRSEPGRIVLVP